MNTIAKLQAVVGADISGLKSGMNEANGIVEGASGKLQKAGGALMGVGTKLTAGVTVPMIGAGVALANTAGDFESQINLLAIAARSSGTAMDELREAAIAVGGDTRLVGIDATQSADAMTNFYKAGMSTADIFGDLNQYLTEGTELTGAMRAAIDLAAASDLSLAQASDTVAVAMATFGLESDDATSIADSFVRAADASVAEVSELTDALGNVGPEIAGLGWDLNDANTALAILSERGIRGAEAGTNLGSMLTSLMKPTDSVTAALEMLGVTLYDDEGALRSLPDILADIETGMAGVTEEQKNNAIQDLAGSYGKKAMRTLLEEGAEGWADMESAINTAATAQEVAAARTKGLNAGIENLKGTVETFMIKAGLPFIEQYVTPAVTKLTDLVSGLSDVNPEMLDLGIKVGIALAAAGPLSIAIGGIVKGLGLLLSPVGLAAGAIAGVTAAIIEANGGFDTFKTNLIDAFGEDGTSGVLSFLGEAVANTGPWAALKLGNWAAEFKTWAESKDTQAKFEEIGNAVGDAVVGGLEGLFGAETTSDSIGASIANMMGRSLANALAGMGDIIDAFAQGVADSISLKLFGAQGVAKANENKEKYGIDMNKPIGERLYDLITGLFGGMVPDLTYGNYADGTSFAPGGWSLVGERGPELVNLPAGSQVMSNEDSQRAMSGTTVNVQRGAIVINTNGSAREAERGVLSALRQIGVPA